jgi:hypothetical protein
MQTTIKLISTLTVLLVLAAGAYAQTEDDTTTFDFSDVPDEAVFFVDNGEVADGVLSLSIPEESDGLVDIALPATDYALAMDITFSAYSEEATILIFSLRFQFETGCSYDIAYDPAFGIAAAGPFTLDDCQDWDITDEVSDLPTMALGQTYRLSLVAEGSTYQMLLDGEALISAEDDTFTDGAVGFFTVAGPAELTIDNITISDPAAVITNDAMTEAPSGGLFGGSADTAPTTEPSSGGLFGGSSESSATATPASGGLFGGSADTAPTTEPSSGGLFGGSSESSATATPASGGLFGGD